MPLVHFFETSFGRTTERHIVLVEVASDGLSGWGEVTARRESVLQRRMDRIGLADPARLRRLRACWVTISTSAADVGAAHARTSAATSWRAADWKRPSGIWRRACLDSPLWQHIGGGARREIPCGVSIGIQDSVPQLLEKIETELAAGYQRIKMKIKPGWDVDVVRASAQALSRHPADGRRQFRLHAGRRRAPEACLDEFYLMMIEQPLAHDDIIDHAKLQAQLKTPICLDECIRSAHQAEQAIAMDACRIINIKLGRVGGFAEAKRVHDVAQAAGIPVWCGGMLESGIGRAHNIALATLPNFVLPGDVSASQRYWARDIIQPPVEVTPHGTIAIRDEPGFGYELDREFLDSITVRQESIS